MTNATPKKREGDLELSLPFSLLIPKPANKTLPHRKSGDTVNWLTKLDRLARQEDAAANYTASCWYFAAALEPCIAYAGATDINTLHIEQFLAQNLFDNDRQQDALKLFKDILAKCGQVKSAGNFDTRYEVVVKSVIGCICEYAQGFYEKRKYDKAKTEYQNVLKTSQKLLGAKGLTAKIESKLSQATKKEAEALENKSVVSSASKSPQAKIEDHKDAKKEPPSPKVKIEKPSDKVNSPNIGPSKEDKGKSKWSSTGSRTPSPSNEKMLSPDPKVQDTQPPSPSKSSPDPPDSQLRKNRQAIPAPKNPPKDAQKGPANDLLQVPGKNRASSVGGQPRTPKPNDDPQKSNVAKPPRRNSDVGVSKPVIYGKTFDAIDSDGKLIKLDTFKWNDFNEDPKSTDPWSFDRLTKTHDFLINKCRNNVRYDEGNESRRTKRRVRIAILDTGIDMNHPEINARKDRIKGFHCQIKGLEDKANEDSSGHGTSATLILMQIAPEADIYVARVFKETHDVVPDHVAPAIEHAVNQWQVDIISMSFGFPSRISKMDAALKSADMKNVLLFAAASNDGANEEITRAWPARDDSKIFCIHATDFRGWPWKGNPPSESATVNFATLGVNVLTAGRKAKMVGKTGTSIATPIAAATAALLIDFARLPRLKGKQIEHVDQVASFHGMRKLLLASSTKIGENNFRYIKPWHLFSSNKYEYDSIGLAMQTELRKYFG